MTTTILDGKKIAAEICEEVRREVEELKSHDQRAPHLAIVVVGRDTAQHTNVANKIDACDKVGIEAECITYNGFITEQTLLTEIQRLNSDETVNGIIVQLPLPNHMCEQNILAAIDPRKDVDGLTPTNMWRTMQGLPAIVGATPRGIRELLARYRISTEGKHVVVIGRSNLVGKPIAMMLMQRPYQSLPGMHTPAMGNATVTVCNSKTENLATICKSADIIVAAAGCPNTLTASMVKNGAIVIDVGINRIEDASAPEGFRIVGDVDYDCVVLKAAYITPVPGGVEPMTIASLLQNTMQAYKYGV